MILKSNYINEGFIIALLVTLYTSSTLITLDSGSVAASTVFHLKLTGTLVSVVCFMLVILKHNLTPRFTLKFPVRIKSKSLLYLWIVFSFLVVVSQILKIEFPLEGLAFLSHTVVLFVLVPAVSNRPVEVILKAALISSLAFILYSFLLFPVETYTVGYAGLTGNSNSLGQISLLASLSSFCLALTSAKRQNRGKLAIYLLAFFFAIFVLILTQSRTSLFSCLIVITLVFMVFEKRLFATVLFLLGPVLAYIFFYYLDSIVAQGVLQKSQELYYENNLLNNRLQIWDDSLSNIRLLGLPSEAARQFHSHNSFLFIFLRYGVPVGVMTLAVYGAWILASVRYALKSRYDDYYFVPFVFILSFLLVSIPEVVFSDYGNGYLLVVYSLVGVMIYSPRSKFSAPSHVNYPTIARADGLTRTPGTLS